MTRPKRQNPYNPALAEYQRQQAVEEDARKRDRKSRDYSRGVARHVAPIEVADPDSKDSLERIVVMRSTRDDPLGDQHARKTISEAQYQAGRMFQQDFELAENGPRAIDPGKEYVDGGALPELITEARMRIVARLNKIEAALGIEGSAVVHQVLVFGWTMRAIAGSRGLTGRSWEDYFGKRFRSSLDTMAVIYGLAMR